MENAEISRGLAFVRFLFCQAEEQGRLPHPQDLSTVLSLHDAVEMFLYLVASHVGVELKQKTSFEQYFEAIANKGKPVSGRMGMIQLNLVRVAIKHHLISVTSEQVESCLQKTRAFFDDNSEAFFGRPFADIDMLDLVRWSDVQDGLRRAREYFKSGKRGEAIAHVAMAFRRVESQVAMTLEDGRVPALSNLSSRPDDVVTLLRLLLVGVSLSSYCRFLQIAPPVGGTVHLGLSAWMRQPFTDEEFDFCYRFVTDAALSAERAMARIERERVEESR